MVYSGSCAKDNDSQAFAPGSGIAYWAISTYEHCEAHLSDAIGQAASVIALRQSLS